MVILTATKKLVEKPHKTKIIKGNYRDFYYMSNRLIKDIVEEMSPKYRVDIFHTIDNLYGYISNLYLPLSTTVKELKSANLKVAVYNILDNDNRIHYFKNDGFLNHLYLELKKLNLVDDLTTSMDNVIANCIMNNGFKDIGFLKDNNKFRVYFIYDYNELKTVWKK